ncbi:MAG: hypothetical protein GF329_00145 [Candidatus Lokiarchaeota archaeon]|nr:hypothetical protein [Candidatus Lokiarchaeota archaeon]
MNENITLPDKRKLLIELILKLLAIKEKSSQDKPEMLEKINNLMKKIEEFKKQIEENKEKIKENIIKFLNNTNILEKLSDLKLKHHINEQLDTISIDREKLDKKDYLFIRDKSEQYEKRDEISQIKTINYNLDNINSKFDKLKSKLVSLEETSDKESKKSEIKNKLSTIFQEIQSFKLDNKESYQSFFKYINENVLKLLKNKKLNFSFIQLKRAYNKGILNENNIVNYFNNTLLVELSAAAVLYLLRNDIKFQFDELLKITGLKNDLVLKAIILLLDRKLIELVETNGTLRYKLIIEENILVKYFKEIINNLQNIYKEIKEQNISSLLSVSRRLLENIKEKNLKEEQKIIEILTELLKEISDLREKVIQTKKEIKPDILNLEVLAGMELYRMKNIPLIFEKGQYIAEEKEPADLGQSEMANYFNQTISEEYNKALIIVALKNYGPMTPSELAKVTKIKQRNIVDLLLTLIKDNKIEIISEKNEYFLYDIHHELNQYEEILRSFIDNCSSIIHNLDWIKKLKELNSSNFGVLNSNLISIREKINKLMELEYDSKIIFQGDLNSLKSSLKSLLRISESIDTFLKKEKLTVNIENLIPIKIPQREDEIEVDYDQYIVGFGELNWKLNKCLGCRSCVDICPEDALILRNEWDIQNFIEMNDKDSNELPQNRRVLLDMIKNLAIEKPERSITLPKDYLGLGNIEIIPIKCIACNKCDERCPNEAIEFKKIWDLPEVMREFLKQSTF